MVYSDGITESQNGAGEEFGYRRLEDQLRRAAGIAGDRRAETGTPQGRTADGVLFSVLGAVQDFAAACPLVDDMSLAVICRDSC